MTKDEALKQTLEAFELLIDKFSDVRAYEDEEYAFTDELIFIPDIKKAIKAIAAAKEALAQPERQWVGLTDDEKVLFSTWLDHKEDHEVFAAIEAKLKEKNT
jgi:hypothetical protein